MLLRRPFINNNEVSNRLIVVRDRREAVLFRMKSICSLFREFRFESFVSRVSFREFRFESSNCNATHGGVSISKCIGVNFAYGVGLLCM